MTKLYTELGVNPGVDEATLKEAFRRRAQATHPDKGGAPGEFERVREAYEVLSDPARRKSYDETGSTVAQPSVEEEAEKVLGNIFLQYLDSGDPRDPITSMRDVLKGSKAQVTNALKSADSALAALAQVKGKLRRKGTGAPTLTMVLEAKERSLQSDRAAQTRALKVLEALYAKLSEWECVGWEADRWAASNAQMDEIMSDVLRSAVWGAASK